MTDEARADKHEASVAAFQEIWDRIGGCEFVERTTPAELIAAAQEHGATDGRINIFLLLQETIKELGESSERPWMTRTAN